MTRKFGLVEPWKNLGVNLEHFTCHFVSRNFNRSRLNLLPGVWDFQTVDRNP